MRKLVGKYVICGGPKHHETLCYTSIVIKHCDQTNMKHNMVTKYMLLWVVSKCIPQKPPVVIGQASRIFG